MPIYIVKTNEFGEVQLEWPDIATARKDAKRRFGVPSSDVRRAETYRRCESCDSAPCCCPSRS